MNYKGFSINTPSDARPWGARETQAWKDIIDTVVMDCVVQTLDITGHKHYRLFGTAGNVALTVDNIGQIGIGITVPTCPVDIHGSAVVVQMSITGTQWTYVNLIAPIGVGIYFGKAADPDIGVIQYSHAGDDFEFYTNGTEKMRLDAKGNLGLGNLGACNGAVTNSLILANGTAPNALTANQIYIYSTDITYGVDTLASLGLFVEHAIQNAAFIPDSGLPVQINGVNKLLLLCDFPD